MKPVNLPSGAQRNVNAALLLREEHNGAGPFTIWLMPQQTFRVSAGAGDVEVKIDNVVACTLRANEIEWFNVGMGWRTSERAEIEVVITGASRVQVASESDTPQRPSR
jgi:hypothetical protein